MVPLSVVEAQSGGVGVVGRVQSEGVKGILREVSGWMSPLYRSISLEGLRESEYNRSEGVLGVKGRTKRDTLVPKREVY